jgi:hypothetical protein
MKSTVKIQEGDVFHIPVKCRTIIVGVVARKGRLRSCVLSYIFDTKLCLIDLVDIQNLLNEIYTLVDIVDVSTLDIKAGAWPVLGALSPWKREEWPVPAFRNRLGQYSFRDDNDYQREIPSSMTPPPAKYYRDATYGCDALVGHLEDLLDRS